ncbi:pilin/secretion family protein with methylation motif [Thioalkalivibrio sp. ALE21]|nr:pilin/secretion family protein with methylation motif [Thioalkalivibrio sp. ALE21]
MHARWRSRIRGVTLVELMVGILVGMLVVAGVIALYLNVLRGAGFVVQEARVTQESRIAMDFMINDVRRAGFSHRDRASGLSNPFTEDDRNITIHDYDSGTRNCILLSYDPTFSYDASSADHDPLESDLSDLDTEGVQYVFGYRLDDGELQMLTGGLEQTDLGCDGGDWASLTDPGSTNVTDLSFSTEGSSCLNLSVNRNDDDYDDDDEKWVNGNADSAAHCADDEADGGYDGEWEGDAGDDNNFVETRRINITLTARDRSDSGTNVNLQETVRVRNNRIFVRQVP